MDIYLVSFVLNEGSLGDIMPLSHIDPNGKLLWFIVRVYRNGRMSCQMQQESRENAHVKLHRGRLRAALSTEAAAA